MDADKRSLNNYVEIHPNKGKLNKVQPFPLQAPLCLVKHYSGTFIVYVMIVFLLKTSPKTITTEAEKSNSQTFMKIAAYIHLYPLQNHCRAAYISRLTEHLSAPFLTNF